MDAGAVLTRLVQYMAVCALGGSSLFFVYGPAPQAGADRARRAMQWAAGLGVLGVGGWLMAQAALLGSGPSDAFSPSVVWSVASDTRFGRAALVRAALLAAALGVASLPRPGRARWTVLAALGLAAAASFAWTGHGASDEGLAGVIHLGADIAHLLSAAIWLGALFVLPTMLIGTASAADARRAANALHSFSRIGVAVVAVVTASGLVNGWFLVGPRGVAILLTTPYGQLLAAKLALFVLMLLLAAANRYAHARRLDAAAAATAAPDLRAPIFCIIVETAAGALLLALVSWLGTLAPTGHA